MIYEPERYVIGSVLLDPRLWPKVRATCRVEDFMDISCRGIFVALEESEESHGHIVAEEVARRASRNGVAISEAAKMVTYVPHVSYFDFYLKDMLRGTIERLGHDIGEDLSDDPTESGMARAIERLSDAKMRLDSLNDEDIDDVVDAVTLAVAADEPDTEPEGTDAWYSATSGMDNYLGGRLRHGGLIVIGARAGTGKSLFAIQSLMRNSEAGHMPMLLSLEMSGKEVGQRVRRMIGGDNINTDAIKERMRLRSFVVKKPASNIASVISCIERYTLEGIQVYAIDYLQLIGATGKDQYHQMTNVMNALQDASKRLGVTIMALSQMRRPSDSKKPGPPTVHELRDTGRIEEAADAILLLRRPSNEMVEENGQASPRLVKLQESAEAYGLNATELFAVHCGKVRDRAKPIHPFVCKFDANRLCIADASKSPKNCTQDSEKF